MASKSVIIAAVMDCLTIIVSHYGTIPPDTSLTKRGEGRFVPFPKKIDFANTAVQIS
jgi:hypothetical protein